MVGIVDVGGGMRGIYTAGVYDYLHDHGVKLDYCLGVSAGAANLVSYLSGQRGRNRRYYTDYANRPEYMSLGNFLKKGSYFDVDYIYSTLSDSHGEDPIDYAAFAENPAPYVVVATDAESGLPRYFTREDIHPDDFDVVKASCSLPIVCQPYPVKGAPCFDGGVSDPVPYKRAFADGCDRVVVLLTRPKDFRRPPLSHPHAARLVCKGSRMPTLALSGLCGSALLCAADILARSVAATELPVSIFTSLLGAPFLVFLLVREGRKV